MPAIENVVGAVAVAGAATRKSFFPAAIAIGHAEEARDSSPGHSQFVEFGPPARSGLLASDNPGLRFSRWQRISPRGGSNRGRLRPAPIGDGIRGGCRHGQFNKTPRSVIFQKVKMTKSNESGISGVYDSAEGTAYERVKRRIIAYLALAFPVRTNVVPPLPIFDTRSSIDSRHSCGLGKSERRKLD
jgi:hypothetical protein